MSDLSLIEKFSKDKLSFENIVVDSRFVQEGDLFLCLSSASSRASDFVLEAQEKGANVIVSYKNVPVSPQIHFIHDPFVDNQLPDLCRWVYGDSWNSFTNIAITGTDGKTSVSYMIEAMFKNTSFKTGVLGTVNYRIGTEILAREKHTTPPLCELYRWGRDFAEKGVTHCIIEASSHGLKQGRLKDLPVKVAVFTNLTHDHLDYHSDHNDYLRSKKKLFDALEPSSFAVVNADDPFAEKMVEDCKACVLRYGFSQNAEIRCLNFSSEHAIVQTPFSRLSVRHSLIGHHNLLNLLAMVGVGFVLELDSNTVKTALEKPLVIPGRLESHLIEGRICFLDYAHTPHALETVLRSICSRYPQSRLFLIFGCGGDRDRQKRFFMGRVAEKYADVIVVTSDNPRGENPQKITQDICLGIASKDNIFLIESREEAIAFAFEKSQKDDVLLIAGKGHESYQEICGVRHPFDDRSVLEKLTLK